mgnify:FL=1
MAKYFTIQNNVDTSITSGTLVGQLGFAASNDSDGGDAIVITAAVIASADGTFDATNNPGSLVFATSPTGPATGQIKIVDSGHLEPIGNKIKNLGSSSSQWKDLYVDQIYFDGLGPQTLPFNDFNVSATGDTVTVTDGNTVTFTGQDSVTVSRDGQTIIISGAAGGGGGVSTGPAQTIAFFSGDGSLTGTSDFTYDEALTSVKLVTQGDTLTTGYYIQNAQTQTGNMFQVDTYIETIQRNTISGDVIADTGDGYVSTQQPPGFRFDNTSQSLDFTYQAGGSINSTGMLPFNIPNFNADLSADDIEDGAKIRVYNSNSNTPQQVAITGYIAIYTGSADPTIPQDEATFMSYGAQVGLSTPLVIDGPWGAGSTGNVSESDDFTPALQQYFGLHPSNTGNIIVFWYPTSTTGTPAQNQVYSSNNPDSGVSPRLTLQYYSYSGTDTFIDKTNYVVDYQGKLRLNTNDYANVGNQNMIYVSGQENLPCNMVLNSSNGQTKIVHWRGGQKLFTVGGNTPGTDWSIFDNVNSSKPIKIDNTEPSYGTYRDEQVIMRWKGGKVGIYDTSPDYDLDIHGDLGVRSGIYLYNAETVGYDSTAHRLYRSGNTLMWNGSAITGAGGGGSMTSWDLGVGSEAVSTITDGDTVTFSGLNQITTTRSTNRIDIDIDLSSYYTSSQVDTISGNLQTQIDANDNYQYWTVTDGVTSENISSTNQVKFTGAGATHVGYNASNNTVTITTAAGTTYSAGTGLTLNGTTFDANVDPTTQTEAAQAVTSTTNKTYAIQVDASDYMVVNVPWTDNNTTYSAGSGLVLNGTTFDAQVDNSTIEIATDTFQVKDGGITNAKLANSSVTITPGTGIGNAGSVSLGSSVTINANSATTSQVGVVQLQDSATNGTVDKAITPNAVYDISGNLQTAIDTKDNYQYWTLKGDAATTTNVDTTEQVEFKGAGSVTVELGGTDNRVVTISGISVGGGMTNWNLAVTGDSTSITEAETVSFTGQGNVSIVRNGNTVEISGSAGGGGMTSWDLGVGAESVIDVTDGESVTFSGLNQITTTRTAQRIDIDVDLSDYYTSSQVDTISGNLQSDIDGKDNYQYWNITDGVTSENIASTNQVKFTGAGATHVGYNSSNNTVTITSTDNNTTYTAGSGLVLNGTTFDAQVDNSTIEINSDTFRVKDGGVTNAKLQNSSITITPGTGIGNAGAVSLGGSVIVNANSATTSQVGVVQLQDSATNGTVDKAITPNAVYDISGNLQTSIDAKDNYQYWTITDGVTSENISTTDSVKFTGGSNIGVNYNTANNTVTISSTAGGGSMSSWNLQVGSETPIDVTDSENVSFSGLNQIKTTRTSQRVDIDIDLSDYYTSAQVDTISGNLQTQIDANDNYQYWTITDGVNSENVSTTDTIKFTGGGNVGVSYNTSNNTVTISATAGGGTPGGNSTEFQYNNGGSFAGTTGVVYGATNGTGTIFEVHGTGSPKDTLFAVEYTGVDTPTTVSIYNNDGQTANTFQVLTEGSGDLFTVSPTGKIYYNSSYSKIANSGNIGSSMTFDLDTSNIFTGTLTTTSITLSTTNEDVGQRFILRLKQGSGGSKTVGTWFGNRVMWPGGSAPTLSTTAGHVDLFGFLVTSGSAGTFYYDGFTIATGLQ